MAIYAIKPWFRGRLAGATQRLVRRGVSPDAVTVAGVLASFAGGAALAAGRWAPSVWWSVPVFALLRLTANALDGLVAEESGQARPAGELFNETADRVGDAAFLVPIATLPGQEAWVPLAALAAAAIASFVGISARAAGATRRYDGPMGKPDRMAVVAVAAAVAAGTRDGRWLTIGCAVIAIGAVVTALNRYRHAHRELEGR